jgi:hypothetical protein
MSSDVDNDAAAEDKDEELEKQQQNVKKQIDKSIGFWITSVCGKFPK